MVQRELESRGPGHKAYPYLLRNMAISRPDHVWASDITSIPLQHGFLYLTAVMDLSNRNVLSWRLSNALTGDVCVEALNAALARGRPEIVEGVRDARALSASWRDEYNTQRPHSSLGYQTRAGFAAACAAFASAKASAQAAHAACGKAPCS